MGGLKTDSGERLRTKYHIPAAQVRYHWAGQFFMPLEKFPGALADRNGYVLFPTEHEYLKSSYLDHRGSSKNPRLGVPSGISKLPTYVPFSSP